MSLVVPRNQEHYAAASSNPGLTLGRITGKRRSHRTWGSGQRAGATRAASKRGCRVVSLCPELGLFKINTY